MYKLLIYHETVEYQPDFIREVVRSFSYSKMWFLGMDGGKTALAGGSLTRGLSQNGNQVSCQESEDRKISPHIQTEPRYPNRQP